MKKIIVSTIFLLISNALFSQNYIVGDSQSFYIAKHSQKAKILKPLAKVGIGVAELNKFVQSFSGDETAKNIFISIGVNDGYFDKGIKSLIQNFKSKFPNANLFVVRGSYGWGNVQGATNNSKQFLNYYNLFKKEGVFVFGSDIGNGDPHTDKYEYWKLAVNIDCIIYDTEGYKCVYQI